MTIDPNERRNHKPKKFRAEMRRVIRYETEHEISLTEFYVFRMDMRVGDTYVVI